jgi:hypothetical protein
VLTVLSLIQGFAFNYLAFQLPSIYRDIRTGNYVAAVHFVLCFVILVRMYQTFMAAVLDYDFLLPRSFEILLITTLGTAEFFLFSTLKHEDLVNFNTSSFHKRGILLSSMAATGYFLILLRVIRQRGEGIGPNIVPFKIDLTTGRKPQPKKKRAAISRPTFLSRFKYETPPSYYREVLLQEVNVLSLLVIIAIEVLIVLYNPGRGKLTGLVLVIIAILCANVFYSTRVTFGRRQKPSKPQPS